MPRELVSGPGPGKTPVAGSVTPDPVVCKVCGGPLPPPCVGYWGDYCSGACEFEGEDGP